jgi:hypothetical protein
MPKIDVGKIDDQIRKLEELKRFMSDPTTAPMIEQLISQNGSVNAASRPTEKSPKLPHGQVTQRGALLAAVENTCKILPGDFNQKEVIEKLESQGYAFQAKDKNIAVYSALKRLVKRGVLHLTSKGKGKKPSTYRLRRFPREMEGTAA